MLIIYLLLVFYPLRKLKMGFWDFGIRIFCFRCSKICVPVFCHNST